PAEDRTDHRARAAADQEPVRARLHLRPALESAEGRSAVARRRDPQRHQDGRRRVRHLPEHHRRRRPARRAHLLPCREPPRADLDAVGESGGAMRRALASLSTVALCVLVTATATAQPLTWPSERPPQPTPARDIPLPPYEIQTLANGLQVVAVLQHEQPAVSMRLLVRAGTSSDPKDKLGLAHLAASLLDQGTTNKSSQEMNDAVDFIGAAMGAGAGTDHTLCNMVVMKDSFETGMRMLSDMARHPGFAPAEIERQRQQMLSGLQVSAEDPSYVADSVFD